MADIGENMDDFIGTFDEIAAVFKKAKIELVHAGIFRGSGLREEPVIRVFGDLESFVRAAVAFEVKVAFIETCLLSEDDFILDDLNDEYDDDAGPRKAMALICGLSILSCKNTTTFDSSFSKRTSSALKLLRNVSAGSLSTISSTSRH